MTYLRAVVRAAVVGDHHACLLSDDGTVGDVDFSAREWTGVFVQVHHPAYLAQTGVDGDTATIPAAPSWPAATICSV